MKFLRLYLSMLKTFFLFCSIMIFTISGAMFSTVTAQDLADTNKITVRHSLPDFVPLKVELFGLESADVLRDLEVKVTNLSKKPIYFLRFGFRTVDVKISGNPIELWTEYGRHELNSGANEDEDQSIKPTDKPINPNETIIFKLHKNIVEAHKRNIEIGLFPKPSTYELVFIDLMYGDGTGFFRGGAVNRKTKQF